MSRMLSSGVGHKPHRDRPVLIRDLDMMRNALSALPLEGALYELSVIRSPGGACLMIQLRLDEPVDVTLEVDQEAETLPRLPKFPPGSEAA